VYRKYILIAGIVCVFAGSFLARRTLYQAAPSVPSTDQPAQDYRRIVSLAPSVTETLFALGKGDIVVGVTQFCDYPPEVRAIAKVGGYFDPNYEAIAALDPDVVILLPEHVDAKRQLEQLGLHTVPVDHNSIEDILNSIRAIGRLCDVTDKAAALVREMEATMEAVKQKTADRPRPRVMICVGRNLGSGRLADLYIAGNDGLYNRLTELAGGTNAYTGDIPFPTISEEGILRINPEIIIDIIPDLNERGLDAATLIKEWDSIPAIDAVRNKRVNIFSEDYISIPGPRFILTLKALARHIHPELEWES
jgi:iron complex transport system substrate-binding protein